MEIELFGTQFHIANGIKYCIEGDFDDQNIGGYPINKIIDLMAEIEVFDVKVDKIEFFCNKKNTLTIKIYADRLYYADPNKDDLATFHTCEFCKAGVESDDFDKLDFFGDQGKFSDYHDDNCPRRYIKEIMNS